MFDLDGVVTDTAATHAAAWKEVFDKVVRSATAERPEAFVPFDVNDYRRYVDGRPRYEGVATFLGSRGIALPWGHPSDPPEAATICGVGNRKNAVFLELLERGGVRVFDDPRRFLDRLAENGIRVGLHTSSKNGRTVLGAAGLLDRFETIVDGNDLVELNLAGKPDPAPFREVAHRLGVAPLDAAVVEDAVSGVRAGRRGGFGVVVGVARGEGSAQELLDAGADIAVVNLDQLPGDPLVWRGAGAPPPRRIADVPDASPEAILGRLGGHTPVVFCDFDGTLSEIVADPDAATITDSNRSAVARLARQCPVAVVSGRVAADVARRLGVDGLYVAGSHGFELLTPDGETTINERAVPWLPRLATARDEVQHLLADVPGVLVEDKTFAIAAHYRNVDPAEHDRVRMVISEQATRHGLAVSGGKMVVELRPPVPWDKGAAVIDLLSKLAPQGGAAPVYFGDDLTDEDAYRVLRGWGVGVVVRGGDHRTAADFAVDAPSGVAAVLDVVADWLEADREQRAQAAAAPLATASPASDPWVVAYDGYDPPTEGLREALCALGNGRFVTRGASADSRADGIHYPGTYLAGGYNRLASYVGDRVIVNEDLVNLPNWLALTFRASEARWFNIDDVDVLDCHVELDMRSGLLVRSLRVRDRDGRASRVLERRVVSMADPNLAATSTTIVPEDWGGPVEILTGIDGNVRNAGVPRYRSLNDHHLQHVATSGDRGLPNVISIVNETTTSRLWVALAARTVVSTERHGMVHYRRLEFPGVVSTHISLEVAPGEAIDVEKVVSLRTTRDRPSSEPLVDARRDVERAPDFATLVAHHELAWQRLWQRSHMDLESSDPAPSKICKLHLFHLNQTLSEHSTDLDVGVPARGWHGEAYRGHIFWDELFILPFLDYRFPQRTRGALLYRYRRLPEARRAARAAGYRGAMYPWQSASSGTEETQRTHLNPKSGRWLADCSHLQRHINISIAYNIWHHWLVAEEHEFMFGRGAEMLLEIARFWSSIATFDEGLQRWRIPGVMGPDEYHERYPDRDTPGLDDNAYTNIMTAWVLRRAIDVLDLLPATRRQEMRAMLEIGDAEIERWKDQSARMYVPIRPDGIISQFEGWDQLPEFDWYAYRARYGDISRLDRILEAENDSPNNYRLSKQADTLMVLYLLGVDGTLDLLRDLGYEAKPEWIPANVDYHLARTSHGSTLSRVVHAWVLAQSDRSRSWALFLDALRADVDDVQGGTTAEGIHLGAMVGAVDIAQRCYTGMAPTVEGLQFNPQLPDELHRLEFNVRFRSAWSLAISLDHEILQVQALSGPKGTITIEVAGVSRQLSADESARFTLADRES